MNIGILCYPTYGGSGVVATELGHELAKRGHQVHFITYEPPFRLKNCHRCIFYHQVEVPDYPLFKYPPYSLALANKIVEVYSTEGLDILHCHYAIPHSIAAFLAQEILHGGLKVITTLHGTDITLVGNDESFRSITHFGLLKSDGLTAVSHNLARDTRDFFDFHGPIKVIHNFIDTSLYYRYDKESLDYHYQQGHEKIVIHVSNFRPVKNILQVIKIFYGLSKEVEARLLMVGDGPLKVKAIKLTKELGIQEKVHFLGRKENIIPLLSQSHLFLLPSVKESFGLVALEAMACGVPVVASNTGGLKEVVLEGESGHLLPPDDREGMIQAGLKILLDKGYHRSLSEKGVLRAKEHFSNNLIIPKYLQYYEEVLGG